MISFSVLKIAVSLNKALQPYFRITLSSRFISASCFIQFSRYTAADRFKFAKYLPDRMTCSVAHSTLLPTLLHTTFFSHFHEIKYYMHLRTLREFLASVPPDSLCLPLFLHGGPCAQTQSAFELPLRLSPRHSALCFHRASSRT